MPNCPDLVLLFLAVTALGAAAAPLNPAYTESELRFFLRDIRPRYFLIPAGRPTAAASAAEATSTPVLTVEAGDVGQPDVLAAGRPVRPDRSFERGGPDDVAVVLHTSGTTSRPKQVPLRQRNLMASARDPMVVLPVAAGSAVGRRAGERRSRRSDSAVNPARAQRGLRCVLLNRDH
jgi:acyl-CoA synthetase (AMP-forming)/AMP-acid ligase II